MMTDPMGGEQLPMTSQAPGRMMVQGPSMYSVATAPKSNQNALAWNLLKALYRRWMQAAVFGVLAAIAVGAAVWFLLPPPMPSATAKLLIPQKPPTNLYEHPDPPLEKGTQIAIVRSYLVLSSALRSPTVNKLPVILAARESGQEPEEWLAKNLTVDFSEGQEVMRISLSCPDGDQAKAIVEAVKNSYLQEVANRSDVSRKDRLKRLQEMGAKTKLTLDRQREAAAKLAPKDGQFGEKSIELKQKLAYDLFIRARDDLKKTSLDLNRLRTEKMAYESNRGRVVELPDSTLDYYVEEDEAVIASQLNRARLEDHLKKINETAVNPEKTDEFVRVQSELKQHEEDHKKLVAEVRKKAQERVRSKSAADQAYHLSTLTNEINVLTELEKIQTANMDELGKLSKEIHDNNIDIEPYRLEIKLTEDLYKKLRDAATALETEQDIEPRVRELEPARIVPVDTEKRKQFFAGIGALAALAGVGTMVGLRELSLRRVESPDSIAEGLGLPIVGMIPRHPSKLSRTYGNVEQTWQSGMIESINCTRTMLLHGEGLDSLKVIQITSPVSGEGKTTLSTHLALSVALAGRRTLLIDGDLRNPNAHRPFNLPEGPGLCELLRGEAALADTLHPSAIAGLTVMPGGRWVDGTQQTLASAGLEEIFEQIRRDFDFVVVDSSPILPLTDPLLLARHADGVIVSLLQGVSRLPLVEEANQRMAVLGVRVLGAVLNGTTRRKYGYGSYTGPMTTA